MSNIIESGEKGRFVIFKNPNDDINSGRRYRLPTFDIWEHFSPRKMYDVSESALVAKLLLHYLTLGLLY